MKRWAAFSILAVMLALPGRALAQVQAGNFKMNLSGNVSGGYTADFGNVALNDHGFTAGGVATLNGSYYDPNFLNFTVTPFYNQSWVNSDSQSILNSSGVTADASFFSGSNTPGSISYSKILDSSGTFGVPGLANYTSHGNSDAFGVNWTEHLPQLPTVTIGYQQGSSSSSIFGSQADIISSFRGVNVAANYTVGGFALSGAYHFLDSHVDLPEILGQTATESSSTSNSFSLGIGHKLPFNGSFSAAASRSYFNSDYTSGSYRGTLDNLDAGLSLNPTEKLNIGAFAQYNDNLLGSIYEPLIAGGVAPPKHLVISLLIPLMSSNTQIIEYRSGT